MASQEREQYVECALVSAHERFVVSPREPHDLSPRSVLPGLHGRTRRRDAVVVVGEHEQRHLDLRRHPAGAVVRDANRGSRRHLLLPSICAVGIQCLGPVPGIRRRDRRDAAARSGQRDEYGLSSERTVQYVAERRHVQPEDRENGRASHGIPCRVDTVGGRRVRDRGCERPVGGGDAEDVASRDREAPDRDATRIDPGKASGVPERGAPVLQLLRDSNDLPWMLQLIDQQRDVFRGVEREAERFPKLREKCRVQLFEAAHRAAVAFTQRWAEKTGHPSPDPEASAVIMIGAAMSYRRAQWTFGEAPLGVSDERFVETWVHYCHDLMTGTST